MDTSNSIIFSEDNPIAVIDLNEMRKSLRHSNYGVRVNRGFIIRAKVPGFIFNMKFLLSFF